MKEAFFKVSRILGVCLLGFGSIFAEGGLPRRYHTYVTVSGIKHFHQQNLQQNNYSGVYNIWIPIFELGSEGLIYSDLRVQDQKGNAVEGNFNLGYRRLLLSQEILWGFYGSFDQQRSNLKNLLQRVTLGGELWVGNWFLGGNYYQPVGTKTYKTKTSIGVFKEYKGFAVARGGGFYEKAQTGLDLEIGYNWNKNWTSYLGGYAFQGNGTKNRKGLKGRITYEYRPKRAWFGFVEQIDSEGGVQYDEERKTTGYLGLQIRFGSGNRKINNDFSRHMTQLIQKDPNIASKVTLAYKEPPRYAWSLNLLESPSSNDIEDYTKKIKEIREMLNKLGIDSSSLGTPSDHSVEDYVQEIKARLGYLGINPEDYKEDYKNKEVIPAIKKRFNAKSLEFHPDKNKEDEETSDKFNYCVESREIVLDFLKTKKVPVTDLY